MFWLDEDDQHQKFQGFLWLRRISKELLIYVNMNNGVKLVKNKKPYWVGLHIATILWKSVTRSIFKGWTDIFHWVFRGGSSIYNRGWGIWVVKSTNICLWPFPYQWRNSSWKVKNWCNCIDFIGFLLFEGPTI